MAINVKHSGQMPATKPRFTVRTRPARDPIEGLADRSFLRVQGELQKRAVCNCHPETVPTYVYDTPVAVTIRRRRAISTPIAG